jgi:hypothetical protein
MKIGIKAEPISQESFVKNGTGFSPVDVLNTWHAENFF